MSNGLTTFSFEPFKIFIRTLERWTTGTFDPRPTAQACRGVGNYILHMVVHCALCLCIVRCVLYQRRPRFFFFGHRALSSGIWTRQLATGSGLGNRPRDLGSATGNGVWATATGNGLWATATGNGNLEAALLKHEGRQREATLGGNGDGNQQPRFGETIY